MKKVKLFLPKNDMESFYKTYLRSYSYYGDILKISFDETDPNWLYIILGFEEPYMLFFLGRNFQLELNQVSC